MSGARDQGEECLLTQGRYRRRFALEPRDDVIAEIQVVVGRCWAAVAADED